LKAFAKKKGIIIESSAPYTQQQNGVAERFNRTTGEHALAMLKEAGMSNGFWPEAHEYANYVQNRSPTRVLTKVTPYEAFYSKKPDVSNLRIFGSKCHVRVPPEKRTKLDAHSLEGVFCGMSRTTKAYRIWIPKLHKMIKSRDVIVYEKYSSIAEPDDIVIPPQSEGVQGEIHASTEIPTQEIAVEKPPSPEPIPPPEQAETRSRPIRTSRPTWKVRQMEETTKKPPNRAMLTRLAPGEEPASFHEATDSPDADHWWQAMKEEIGMLQRRGTWVLETPPPDRKVIGCRWMYVIKRGPSGEITRYKARLVAQGFSQVPGIDYGDTFSPTVHMDTLRILLHLSAAHRWHRAQDDVTGAFLHSKLDHVVYMRQPPGFEDGTDRVARLILGLYRLMQASRLWHEHMSAKLATLGYRKLVFDNAVFMRPCDSGSCILAVHVDNFVSFAPTSADLSKAREELHLTFEMKEEDPNWLMGFQLLDDRKSGTIAISHTQYIETVLKRFNMHDCNPRATPMDAGLQLSKADSPTMKAEIEEMRGVPYRELVGSLLWVSRIAFPQITHAVCQIARFTQNPGRAHWNAAKQILRYLKGAKASILVLGGDPDTAQCLVAYSDSNWAEDLDDRRSTSGYAIRLGTATVSWSTKKQTTVATSSTEAEYMAAHHCSKQVVWLRNLLTELGTTAAESPTRMYLDNRGAIDIAKDPKHHQRTKHIDVQHHYIRERVALKILDIEHIPSCDMLADGFTKALPRVLYDRMLDGLGLGLLLG
jgi:hypothetical protein